MNRITKVIISILIVSLVFSLLSFVGCKRNDEHISGHEKYIVAIYEPVSFEGDNLAEKLTATVKEINKMLFYNGFVDKVKVELCDNNTKISITIPDVDHADTFLKMFGSPSSFEFRKEGKGEAITTQAYVTCKDLEEAYVSIDSNRHYVIALRFDREGTEKFAKATEERMYQSMNIWINGEWVMGPVVNSVISTGEASITGTFSYEEAYKLANQFNACALTVQLRLLEQELLESE